MLLNSSPTIRSRYLAYGPRALQVQNGNQIEQDHETLEAKKSTEKSNKVMTKILGWILERLDTVQVPHTWFLHFYVVSVLSSLFWGFQILVRGRLLEALCQSVGQSSRARGMTLDQVVITWSLVTVQGARRLLESSFFIKLSGSKMWFVHWLLGMAFYLTLGISCWIEGAGMSHQISNQFAKQ